MPRGPDPKVRLGLDPLDDGLRSLEPSPDAHAEAKQVADRILGFCAELDEGRRTVFVLGLLEDGKFSEDDVKALKAALQKVERQDTES